MAPARLNALAEYLATLQRPPDIIAIQDPPPKFAFKSFTSYGNLYSAADDDDGNPQLLTRDNDPSTYTYRKPYSRTPAAEKKIVPLSKVAFLVQKSLRSCRIQEAMGNNKGIHSTLRVTLADGYRMAFHNVYNHEKRLDVVELANDLMSSDQAHVLVGDINLHHPDWAGNDLPKHKVEAKAKLFVQKMKEASMKCLNTGEVTYGRKERDKCDFASTIDVIYIKDVLADQATHEIVQGADGFDSDHCIMSVSFNLDMHRSTKDRYQWKRARKDAFVARVAEGLKDIEVADLPDANAVENALYSVITQVLEPAIKALVPRAPNHLPRPKSNSQENQDTPTPVQDYRESIEIEASSSRGIFHLARKVNNWSEPRQLACTPDFKVGNKVIKLNHEKVDEYVKSTWTDSRPKGPPLKPAFWTNDVSTEWL